MHVKYTFFFIGTSYFQNAWVLQDIHYITTLLHPSFKNFDVHPGLQDKAVSLLKTESTKRQPPPSSSIGYAMATTVATVTCI